MVRLPVVVLLLLYVVKAKTGHLTDELRGLGEAEEQGGAVLYRPATLRARALEKRPFFC